MAEMTPMMKQYLEMKDRNPDSILFFRLGDFYEMFFDDAKLASKELDLTLTTRDRSKPPEERTPMCGVPYHSCDSYIARLIAKGYKVAICEQTEDPATAKGLVDRDIVRVITRAPSCPPPCWRRGRTTSCAPSTPTPPPSACVCAICPPARCSAPPSPPGRRPGATWKMSWAGSTPPRRCCPTGPTIWTGSPTF